MIKLKVYKPAQRKSYFSPVSTVFVFNIMNKRWGDELDFYPSPSKNCLYSADLDFL
jgi:hypothetical protein